jgi:predicted nucleic acid-binding protein
MQEKYGFVYIWRDKKHKRFYIGSHWGTETDGYICSSSWMKQAYKKRPRDFKRRVISRIYTNRQDLLLKECEWLHFIPTVELGKSYYNLTQYLNGHWTTDENKALTIKEKLSKAQQKRYENNPVSEETRAKISKIQKGKEKSPEHLAKIAAANKGKPKSESFRQKRSLIMKSVPDVHLRLNSPEAMEKKIKTMTGRKLPEEHRKSLSIAKKGRKWTEAQREACRIARINSTKYAEHLRKLNDPILRAHRKLAKGI